MEGFIMELKPLIDPELIKFIITEPELWSRLKEDGSNPDAYEPNMSPTSLYLGIYVEDLLIGLFSFHQKNLSTIDIHANILKDYRKLYAKEAGRLAIAYFAYNTHNTVQKLVAEIPVIYKDVYHFSLNNGLVDEGINRKSILKDGQLVDQHMLGITKEEAQNLQLKKVA
jgi:hypothetical protein